MGQQAFQWLESLTIDQDELRAALQDDGSARIMQACIGKAHSAKEISALCNIAQVTVYRHIKRLVALQLLQVERSAQTPTGKPYDLYRCPLESAGLTISAEGVLVDWKIQQSMGDRLFSLWQQMEERK